MKFIHQHTNNTQFHHYNPQNIASTPRGVKGPKELHRHHNCTAVTVKMLIYGHHSNSLHHYLNILMSTLDNKLNFITIH